MSRGTLPNLLEYTDLNSGERNSVLTPGGMGQVVGHRLKLDPADANQGLFFVAEGGGATRVDVVGRNKPGDLMFMVPDGLAAGDYTLEVRATIHGSEDVRTGPSTTLRAGSAGCDADRVVIGRETLTGGKGNQPLDQRL